MSPEEFFVTARVARARERARECHGDEDSRGGSSRGGSSPVESNARVCICSPSSTRCACREHMTITTGWGVRKLLSMPYVGVY